MQIVQNYLSYRVLYDFETKNECGNQCDVIKRLTHN